MELFIIAQFAETSLSESSFWPATGFGIAAAVAVGALSRWLRRSKEKDKQILNFWGTVLGLLLLAGGTVLFLELGLALWLSIVLALLLEILILFGIFTLIMFKSKRWRDAFLPNSGDDKGDSTPINQRHKPKMRLPFMPSSSVVMLHMSKLLHKVAPRSYKGDDVSKIIGYLTLGCLSGFLLGILVVVLGTASGFISLFWGTVIVYMGAGLMISAPIVFFCGLILALSNGDNKLDTQGIQKDIEID